MLHPSLPRSRTCWVAALAALGEIRSAGAQTPAPPPQAATQAPDALCWRGRPLARCRAFVLFEFSAPRHLAGTRLDPVVAQQGHGHPRWDQGLVSQFVYDVGAMVNIGARDAVGGTLTAGFVTDDPSTLPVIGATARYRRWLTRIVSADAAVGALRMPVGVTEPEPFGSGLRRVSVQRPAGMIQVRLGVADLVGVSGRGIVATDGRGRMHHAVFAGVSVGSTATAALTGTCAALITYARVRAGHGDDLAAAPTP